MSRTGAGKGGCVAADRPIGGLRNVWCICLSHLNSLSSPVGPVGPVGPIVQQRLYPFPIHFYSRVENFCLPELRQLAKITTTGIGLVHPPKVTKCSNDVSKNIDLLHSHTLHSSHATRLILSWLYRKSSPKKQTKPKLVPSFIQTNKQTKVLLGG